jgi:hypothetical protein
MRRVLVAVVVLGALALVPSPSHAQELTEARLQAIEAASRGRSGCGEPELLAAIALYRDAPAGTVLRVRLAAFVQDGAFFAGACRGRSVSARVPTRAAPTSRTQKRSGASARPLLDQARMQGICADEVRDVTELLASLEGRTGSALVVLTSVVDREVARLDHCERAEALPVEVGRVEIVVAEPRRADVASRAALDEARPDIRALYRAALVDTPALRGRVGLALELGTGGNVARCRVERPSGFARPLLLGIVRRIERVVLPGLDEGAVVRIEIELAP